MQIWAGPGEGSSQAGGGRVKEWPLGSPAAASRQVNLRAWDPGRQRLAENAALM